MKMEEIIDKVSELYWEGLAEIGKIQDELCLVTRLLDEVKYNKGQNISLYEYNDLLKREGNAKKELSEKGGYYDGVYAVREMLMNFKFDTEVEK